MVQPPTLVEAPPRALERAPFSTLPSPELGFCRQRASSEANDMLGAEGTSKNLVLVFDGTGNTYGPDLTSMPLLYSFLSADRNRQLSYYQTGIGTYEPGWTPSGIVRGVSRALDAAVAWDLGQHVQDGYAFLMNYYSPGDKIYLFGFSRGAFTARALAGMLQQVGILLPGNEQSISLAYHMYAEGADAVISPGTKLAASFKNSFSMDVRVEFVGVWDTVSSVGAIIPRALPFSAGTSMVNHFRQCLSLDEHRIRFSPQPYMSDTADVSAAEIRVKPTVKEVWFPGCHSNVGGGQTPTDGDITPRLSHLSLRWMVREAMERGLVVDLHAIEESPIFSPFIEDARKKLALKDKDLMGYIHSRLNQFAPGTDPALIAVVYLSTLPSEQGEQDALAPRGDSLSFWIKMKPFTTIGAWISEQWEAFTQRIVTAGWWILEVTPTLRIVWDVEGEARSHSWRWNLGRPRHLTHKPTFHWSVRTRMEASAKDFPPGDGSSVPEIKYKPKAKFCHGETMRDVEWDEGGYVDLVIVETE